MRKIRTILAILLIFPLVLGYFIISDPMFEADHSDLAILFFAIGMPILVLNLWAWDAPHIIKTIFGLKTDENSK